ncbi:MAG: YrdB family protein [Mucilaginibacter sp.]
MNTNPINLAVRFLLEIAMLIILGYWGWHLAGNLLHYIAAAGLPLTAAALWGIFRIPNDPKPAPIAVPGIIRVLLEFMLFGSAVWALLDLDYTKSGWIMAVIVILHYLISYDRTWVMLRNKPYKGFTD